MRVFFFLCRQRFTMASSLALLLTLSGCTNTAPQHSETPSSTPYSEINSSSPTHSISSTQTAFTHNQNTKNLFSTLPQNVPPLLKTRLAEWLKLVSTAHAPAQEYADFLAQTPIWPRRRLFIRRMEQALATETNPKVLNTLCHTQKLTYAQALAQCFSLTATADTALSEHLQTEASQAWIVGNDAPADATTLINTFPALITPAASWKRFQREERAGKLEAARRTLPYLATEQQNLAKAILAFHTGDSSAELLANILPEALRQNPLLVLNHARWLRRNKNYEGAVSFWKVTGIQAEQRAKEYTLAFWHERSALAYELLYNTFAPADVFTIADDTSIMGRYRLDSQFLSGWIALRKMHDPTTARTFFQSLTTSPALLTRSRGFYWLGRAFADEGDNNAAHNAWQNAAAFPSTFYGQMAAACLDGDHDVLLRAPYRSQSLPQRLQQALAAHPPLSRTSALNNPLNQSDLTQAATLLIEIGDRPHARDFLILLLQQNKSPSGLVAVSAIADRLGLQDIAVTAARLAGKNGVLLLRSGWPAPYTPPESVLPTGFVLGLIRQESSFNPQAISPSRAIGLMQLKPSTAADMLRDTKLSAFFATARGLRTPTENMQLGTAYLLHLRKSFGPVIPYITAAYNAGPGRVKRWLNTMGNPAAQGLTSENASDNAMIDWIESIPLSETRNYVQRVWENMAVYAVLNP